MLNNLQRLGVRNMEKQTTRRLLSYVIFEYKDNYGWAYWMDIDNGPSGKFSLILGDAYIIGEALVMTSWKTRTDSNESSWEEVEKVLSKYQKWDKTKYFVKLVDFSSSMVRICENGEFASEEETKRIRKELEFERNR